MGHVGRAMRLPPRFVGDVAGLDEVLQHARLWRCPHCRRDGTLIGHGLSYGYDDASSYRVARGRRLLCSGRGRRSGCGRTIMLRIGSVVTRLTARTCTLWALLCAVLSEMSVARAWATAVTTTLSLRSGYRLWRRWLRAQSHLRTVLSAARPPPPSNDPRPLSQLQAHLHHVLGHDPPVGPCVLSRFQLHFQRPLLG